MPEIRVTWKWKTASPLHVGSGLSRLGVADSLVQRDHEGNAVIHGEAVKGALRMAAEQVVAWLGKPQTYPETDTAEPRLWPLARLFGGDTVARCTAATLLLNTDSQENDSRSDHQTSSGKRAQIFASTAIDRATGTALEHTLRKTEIMPRGLRFEASYTATVASDEVQVVETLLVTALASAEAVGGKAGIGWGRMDLDAVTVAVDGEPNGHEPATVISSARLEKLLHALQSKPPQEEPDESAQPGERQKPTATNQDDQDSQWFKLTIILEEPTCLPGLPDISNKVTTHDWIAATTLRGALAKHWWKSGHTAADVRLWLSDITRWTPAWRREDCNRLALPAPRSFVTTKRTRGATQPLHDTLAGNAPRTSDGTVVQWRSIAGDSILSDRKEREPTLADSGRLRATRMHVARDYRTGSKRTGALYARENLVPGTTFVAWARVPKCAFKHEEQIELFLGKRVSAGNGRAKVGVEEATNGPEFLVADSSPGADGRSDTTPAGDAEKCSVFVQLVAPAVVYDQNGYPRRTLDAKWWQDEVEADADDARRIIIENATVRSAPGRRGGWMGNWQHSRAAVTTIDAGSVWRLCCSTEEGAKCLRELLRRRGQIGERAHEGFGWIVVDPPWLGRPARKTLAAADQAPPEGKGQATSWPGVTTDTTTLADIARSLATETVSEEAGRAFQEVAARVRLVPSDPNEASDYFVRLKEFCRDRAEKNSKWNEVKEFMTAHEEWWEDDHEQLLFALGIMITRATSRRD